MMGSSGSEWQWFALGVFAIAGFFASIAGAVWVVIWLFNHVRFV